MRIAAHELDAGVWDVRNSAHLDKVEHDAGVAEPPEDVVKVHSRGLVERVRAVHCGRNREKRESTR